MRLLLIIALAALLALMISIWWSGRGGTAVTPGPTPGPPPPGSSNPPAPTSTGDALTRMNALMDQIQASDDGLPTGEQCEELGHLMDLVRDEPGLPTQAVNAAYDLYRLMCDR